MKKYRNVARSERKKCFTYLFLSLIFVEIVNIDIEDNTPTIPVNAQKVISKLSIGPTFISMEMQFERLLFAKLLLAMIA